MGEVTRLLLLVCVGVTASTVLDLHKRIIGGSVCGRNERGYHVLLIANNETNASFCGGSLISNQWILTATHCWRPRWNMTAHLGLHPQPGDKYEEMQITAQPLVFMNNNMLHDIMLLQLPRKTRIKPVTLPDCRISKRPKINADIQVAGQAATTMGPNNEREHDASTTLQCANMKVVDCQRLRLIQSVRSPERLNEHWFCGQAPGVDVCHGDSGGGVVYNKMIYGVISFVGNHTHACVEAVGLVDVCEYEQWIKDIIGDPRSFLDILKTCVSCGIL